MKHIAFLTCLIFSSTALANIVARVVDVQGNAFSFVGKKANTLQYGSKISDLSEIMVEDGGTLSIIDGHNHVYHINSGSLVKVFKGMIELQNGQVWVSSSSKYKASVHTPNSMANFTSAEFITSFDNITGKAQMLVLKGHVEYSNALEANLKTNVMAGYFSFVDPKYENGLPRTPTKVGLASYKKMKSKFAHFSNLHTKEIEKEIWGVGTTPKKTAKRSIASVSHMPKPRATSKKVGKIIRITTYGKGFRKPASIGTYGALDYYKKLNKSKKKSVFKGGTAPIKYYGHKWQGKKPASTPDAKMMDKKKQPIPYKKMSLPERAQVKKKATRAPASFGAARIIKDLKKSDFESSLGTEEVKVKRNNDQVNSLIDELKTYNQDYKKNY